MQVSVDELESLKVSASVDGGAEADGAAALPDLVAAGDGDGGVVVNPLSMEQVALQLPDFANVKSMLQKLVDEAGHILQLSPKYHAELAGAGIEYDFGRCKWWFRNHRSESHEGLVVTSRKSMAVDVVNLPLTRKFARKAREYMRVYRKGHTGYNTVQTTVKEYKSHRSALDQSYKFIREPTTD